MFKPLIQSIVQDGITTAAGYFAAHGWITASDEQGFIGSLFFLAMLGINAWLQHSQTKTTPKKATPNA